jgi:CRISPR system Cascade subunit CasD
MNNQPNTVFLRLEGPLQAWGDPSKFVIRRTMEAPTKSGVIGLVCCAMGFTRLDARKHLPELNELLMAVRIDRAGTPWWDYHTVGAGYGILTAQNEVKKTASIGEFETLITRREYLCDASFVAALQGDSSVVKKVIDALQKPKWPPYLGRKSCPPSLPIFTGTTQCDSLREALSRQPWRQRYGTDERPHMGCAVALVEWRATEESDIAPPDAEVWYDKPVSFDPPVHEPRLVERTLIRVQVGEVHQHRTPPPQRPRANYQNRKFERLRKNRLTSDHNLCVFCKAPATTVQHVTYRRAGGNESHDDLRSLCRLCHDAVTMIEYGLGMGLDRIDPCESRWRQTILEKRDQIVRFRSLETRRRRLSPEEVE